jgi:radical SAM protein with 4Fe4S-binding SPASM domain
LVSSALSTAVQAAPRGLHAPVATVEDTVAAVTYRCNSRCRMCGIWKSRSTEPELAPEEYGKLPKGLKDINVSGGEPFLREDLPEVVRVLAARCAGATLVLSTNGLLPDRIEAVMRDLRPLGARVGVGVSIDGVGAVHDEIRGVPGAFERAVDTVGRLRSLGIASLRIGMTIGDRNLSEIKATYDLSRRLGVEFTCSLAQNSDHYFMTQDNRPVAPEGLREELDDLIRAELRTFDPKRWFRAYFDRGIYWQAVRRGRLLGCEAGRRFFFLDPFGNVYPCNILDRPMGNLRQASFEDLWNAPEAQEARELAGGCRASCWMVCTARTAIRRNLGTALGWIVSGKARAHLGRTVLRP